MRKSCLYILLFTLLFSCKSSDDFTEIGNDNFSIWAPGNLMQPTDCQEGSVLHLCEDTASFLNGLSVVVYSDKIIDEGDTNTLYSYYNFVANNLLDQTLVSGNLDTPKDTLINDLKSLLFVTCGESNQDDTKENVCFYTGLYQGKKDFYEVTVWCNEQNVSKYLTSIKRILNSFKEKPENNQAKSL